MLPDNGVIMKVECEEKNGTFQREVRLCELTLDKLKMFYEKLSKFEVLFNEHVGNDLESFLGMFLDLSGFDINPTGLIWEVDDVGILYLTEIRAGHEGLAHFTFWDGHFAGREQLIWDMIQHVFEEYKLHRIYVEVPLYATPAMDAVERIGFIHEGRKREAIRYKGKWFDVNLYSVLEGDE